MQTVCARFHREDPVGSRSQPRKQPYGAQKIHIRECRKEEQTLNATSKADQIEKEVPPILLSSNLRQLLYRVDPPETELGLSANRRYVLDRVEGRLSLPWVRDVGIQ